MVVYGKRKKNDRGERCICILFSYFYLIAYLSNFLQPSFKNNTQLYLKQ